MFISVFDATKINENLPKSGRFAKNVPKNIPIMRRTVSGLKGVQDPVKTKYRQ